MYEPVFIPGIFSGKNRPPPKKNLQFPQTAAKWRANQVLCKRFLTDVFFYGQQTQEIIRHFAIRVQIYAPKMHQHTFSGAGGA